MKILPRRKREAMFVVYTFCHKIDHIADRKGEQDQKLTELDIWRSEIECITTGDNPRTNLGWSLTKACADYNLDTKDFIAIIDGVEMDVHHVMRAPSVSDLDLYCDRVASAVGRLAVAIFGLPSTLGLSLAHVQGRALQLTNILRDLNEDADRGRLYMPAEILAAHGIDPLWAANHTEALFDQPAFIDACRDLAVQADIYFKATQSLLDLCPSRRLARPACLMAAVYQRLLTKLVFENFRSNVRLSTAVKIGLIARHSFL